MGGISLRTCSRASRKLTVWHLSMRQGPHALIPNGHMVRTPVALGPFCHTFSPGAKELCFPQNWHFLDHTSCHICSSENPGSGFGGLVGCALRAAAQMDSDFRRGRKPETGFTLERVCTCER